MIGGEATLNTIFLIFSFLFGASIGSFLNVVAFRVPYGISLISPRSSCPHCETPIKTYALIPILGYLLIRGKCTHCGERVSLRYPLVELFTGVVTAWLFFHYLDSSIVFAHITGSSYQSSLSLGGMTFQQYVPFFGALWLLYTGVALTLIDMDHRILPDVITLPGILVGLAISSINPAVGIQSALIGVALGGGMLYAVAKSYLWLRKKDGMGLGDVKYLAFIGAVVGWQGVIWAIAVASILGTVYGLGVAFIKRQGLGAAIPFGPFLALGAFIVHVWGKDIQNFLYPAQY